MEYRRDKQHDERQQQNVSNVNDEYDVHGAAKKFQRLRGKCVGTSHNCGKCFAGYTNNCCIGFNRLSGYEYHVQGNFAGERGDLYMVGRRWHGVRHRRWHLYGKQFHNGHHICDGVCPPDLKWGDLPVG
jgi:hypothetical protein